MPNPIANFGRPTVITDGATQTFDCSTTSYFLWTLGASRTMSTPTNVVDGQVLWIDINQDATGSRLVTWPSNFRWPGFNTSAPVLQTQALAIDSIRAVYDAVNSVWRAGLNHVRVVPPSKDTANASAGPQTNAAGDLTGAAYVSYRTTNAAPGTVTTRTATLMYADDPDAYIGKFWVINITNTGAATLTLAGGTGVTITGSLTIAAGATRTYSATFATATTVTMQAINLVPLPAAKDTANASAGPQTNAAGDLTGAAYVSYRTTNAAPGTVTTRTATLMFADDTDAYIGKSWILNINNTGAGTLTMVGGTGVTITGSLTVAQNLTRTYFMTFASATTVTGQLISVGSVS